MVPDPLHQHEIDDIDCNYKDNVVHDDDEKAHNNDGGNSSRYLLKYSHLV
jgi:hypothetical protein